MKYVGIYIVLLLFISPANAGEKDSIVYQSKGLTITKNLRNSLYTVERKLENEKLKNLKFAQLYRWRYIQVLDKNNRMYLLDHQMIEVDSTGFARRGFCGTVPHYVMTITETDSSFQVFEDETFYDQKNIPPQITIEVSKTVADSISFMYGRNEMRFTSNFGINDENYVNPRMVIVMKDEQYATFEHQEIKYDSIAYGMHQNYPVTCKDGLFGILNIIEPKFSEVHKFKGFLAKTVLADGTVGYVDIDGNEY